MLFGTNYPVITAAQCLDDLATLDLDDETTELFLGRNAQRVFAL